MMRLATVTLQWALVKVFSQYIPQYTIVASIFVPTITALIIILTILINTRIIAASILTMMNIMILTMSAV